MPSTFKTYEILSSSYTVERISFKNNIPTIFKYFKNFYNIYRHIQFLNFKKGIQEKIVSLPLHFLLNLTS